MFSDGDSTLRFNCNLDCSRINIIELSSFNFFFLQAKAENPIIPLSIFRNRDLNGDLILFATTWGAFICRALLPMWAQALLGCRR